MARKKRRRVSSEQVPDPARIYERAKPEAESGMGRLDNNDDAIPANRPDEMQKAVKNRQIPHQINDDELVDQDARNTADQSAAENAPDYAKRDEESFSWEMAPSEIQNPDFKHHLPSEDKKSEP